MKFRRFAIIFTILILSASGFAQDVVSTDDSYRAVRRDEFLGINLRPELRAIVREIESKTGEKFYTEFIELKDYQLGVSYISEAGAPVVLIHFDLQDDPKKLEAVITHELLHLRLRVNNYPSFLFSSNVRTARGRAVDVEQSNVNDLASLIEHRVFKAEMERFKLNELIDLAGDTARNAERNKGAADGQSDSINYARAILEYPNPSDIEAVARIYRENRWTRALASGKRLADFISRANLSTPQAVESVFLQCLTELYRPPAPHAFRLSVDPENKFFRRLLINTTRKTVRRKSR